MFCAIGDREFAPTTCTKCGKPGSLFDPLSASVTAERLLFRSNAELKSGDFSLSTVIAVMAVESYLTRLFLKFKGMASYAVTFSIPTPAEEAAWEKEYPRSGGFAGPIDFVSQHLRGTSFDKFVAGNLTANSIFSVLPKPYQAIPTQYFQNELFKRQNRITHWGYVNSTESDAELCYTTAVALVSILREMDRSKYADSGEASES